MVQSIGGELPFFFISGWLIRVIGHINAMTMVLFTTGIRLYFYSILTNPWWVLPIELMQGKNLYNFFFVNQFILGQKNNPNLDQSYKVSLLICFLCLLYFC